MRRRLLPILASLLAATTLHAAEPALDSAWIVSKLARPAPMRTDFVELRDSPLLKAPLRLSGEYRRPQDDTLVREVRSPYAETTTIVTGAKGGTATIARKGRSPRTFSLSRVPEMAALQASFGALLSGDGDLLRRHYSLQAHGTRQQWLLILTPTDKGLAGKVRDITLYGRGAELRCIETRTVREGDVQRTLLASAARAAHGVESPKRLAALCQQSAAR